MESAEDEFASIIRNLSDAKLLRFMDAVIRGQTQQVLPFPASPPADQDSESGKS